MDGPARPSKADAERDRTRVGAAIAAADRSSRIAMAARAVQNLKTGGGSVAQVPGSASTMGYTSESLEATDYKELRQLAVRTPGVVRDKKTNGGKWVLKTVGELKTELLSVLNSKTTQTLSGGRTLWERPAARPRKRPASSL